MIQIEPHKAKILAAHFAATMKTPQPSDEFTAFVAHQQHLDAYRSLKHLKQWWDDMDALRVLRIAERQKVRGQETKLPLNPIDNLSVGEDGVICFAGEQIGKIHIYYRTVLPQEIQIRLAYDSLIERFMEFLQRERCAIRLSENQLTVVLFIPGADFQLANEWQRFVRFAYSEEELYKSFTLFVNSMKLTDRGFGYVHFPSVTEAMKRWQAAFYIATLHERVVRYPENYRKAKTEDERREASTANREELQKILTELRTEIPSNQAGFDDAVRLSGQFNRTGSGQFSYGTVKPRAAKGRIEDKIIEILNEPIRALTCPLAAVDETVQEYTHSAGDTVRNRCYSCGGHLLPRNEERYFRGQLTANRFVFSAPSQRLQSGSIQGQPPVCLDCLAVAFSCPIKLAGGAIIVHLSPLSDEVRESVSPEKYLRMLTLGELNLIAGRYLLIHCNERVRERGGSKPVSEKIGQVQYALWRVAQTLPTAALEKMEFMLFAGESEIPLETRHLVWLSHLNDGFSPRLIVNSRDNMRLCQAIRLIQKDEVIAAIYTLATAESTEAKPIGNRSYSEKRSLEELREKHCLLLQPSSKGDKLMAKQADFYRDVAALTGLTYAYCDYVRGELIAKRKTADTGDTGDTVQREVKKLIEKVVNPSFFIYEAADELPGTRATMFRNDDNYFCYDEAKRLLQDTLQVEIAARELTDEKGQKPLSIYFDDILNAYAALARKYNKAQQRKLSYQLKLNLYAKFASLFRKENKQNGN